MSLSGGKIKGPPLTEALRGVFRRALKALLESIGLHQL